MKAFVYVYEITHLIKDKKKEGNRRYGKDFCAKQNLSQTKYFGTSI